MSKHSSAIEDFESNPLWSILVETVHSMIMFPHHKAYTRSVIRNEQPDITPKELAAKLSIPLGEAIIILFELKAAASQKSG